MTSINAVAALCAVNAVSTGDREVFWFIETTQKSETVIRETIDAITIIIGANHAIDHLIIYDVANNVLTHNSVVICDNALRSLCGMPGALFYPHDMSGQYPQILVKLFPEARKICYGDALGHVFEKKVHLVNKLAALRANAGRKPQTLYGLFKNTVDKYVQKHKLFRTSIKPDHAALILPVDESGEFLRRCPMTVCRREVVLQVLHAVGRSVEVPDASVWGSYLAGQSNDKCLLMTECWSEAGFMSPEADIEMYIGVIRKRYPTGAAILVKPHPTEILDRVSLLQERLGEGYSIIKIDDAYVRLPIEIFGDRLRNVRIITAAYAMLSLKYLHDIDVDFIVDNTLLRTYISSQFQPVFKDMITLYNGARHYLPDWDQQSVLFSGNISAR